MVGALQRALQVRETRDEARIIRARSLGLAVSHSVICVELIALGPRVPEYASKQHSVSCFIT